MKADVPDAASRLLISSLINARPVRIDRHNRRGNRRVLERQPAIATANFEHALAAKADETLNEPKLESSSRIRRELVTLHASIVASNLRRLLLQQLGPLSVRKTDNRPGRSPRVTDTRAFHRRQIRRLRRRRRDLAGARRSPGELVRPGQSASHRAFSE